MPFPYDAVLFDFSGVMVASAFDALGALGADHGVSHDDMLELLLGPYDQDTDHPWHRAERGEISIIEWVGAIDADLRSNGIEFDFESMRSVLGAMGVSDEMVAACRGLRADGVRTALVTNNIAEARDSWMPLVPLDELFDVVVDSSAVGCRKPSPEIFHLTLERLGDIAPERALFLDDHPGNCAGARAAGLDAQLVTDPAAGAAELLARKG